MHTPELTARNKKTFLEALEDAKGIVADACRATKIGRTTHYDWMKSDEDYKNAVLDIREAAIDFVESKLFNRIEKEDTVATIFYLKTIGKNRGYVERQEVDQTTTIKPPTWLDGSTQE